MAEKRSSEFEGMTVIVTGGGSGIGRATAVEFASRGAGAVVIVDIDEKGGAESADLVTRAGSTGTYLRCDLARSDEIKAMTSATVDQHGGIDVLVNNAAVLEPTLTDEPELAKLSEEIWDRVFGINLKAAWLCAKAALPALSESDRAAIVNAGSNAGVAAFPMCGAYGASKAAMESLTRSMALEFAPLGIRCNCYVPAAVETPLSEGFLAAADDRDAAMRTISASHLTPRLGQPDEVARLICFLSSPTSGFVNGASYLIDGGQYAWRGVREP